jgi:hypothetical protein
MPGAGLEQFPPDEKGLSALQEWGLLPIGWVETLDHTA